MKIFVAVVLTICAAGLVTAQDEYDIIIRRAEQCREHPDLPVTLRSFTYSPPLSESSTTRKFSADYSVREGIEKGQPLFFQRQTWSCEEPEVEPGQKVHTRHGHHCTAVKREFLVPLTCGEGSKEGTAEGALRQALDSRNPCFHELGDYALSDLQVTPQSLRAQEQQYNGLEINYILYTPDARLFLCLHIHADRVPKA